MPSDDTAWQLLGGDHLDEVSATRLDGLVADALTQQSAALDKAIDGGLGHVPRLLRGPVKKVLFR